MFGEPRPGGFLGVGGQYGFHGQPLHLVEKSRDEATPIRPEARRGFAPITPPPCTGTSFVASTKKTPIILGGIEPACADFAHYDLVRQAEAFYSS